MNNWFQKHWATYGLWNILLIPLSCFYSVIIHVRKYLYGIGWLKSIRLSVPVIVIGNITVGGTGKTPMVIWLAEQFKLAGFNPGIISRGYGGKSKIPTAVYASSDPQWVGDEPVLITKRTGCPMFVGASRASAGKALLKANPQCNIIISDDGLQHYALQRDFEIALVNSTKLFGNQLLLPAGPLREKLSRLQSVDAIVDSGKGIDFGLHFKGELPPIFNMVLSGETFKSLNDSHSPQSARYFTNKNLVAIAGIGNPERFFNQLSDLDLKFDSKAFDDHHAFISQDLEEFSGKTILMTEKDAVKCSTLTLNNAWYLPVTAIINDSNKVKLLTLILQKLRNE